MRNLGKQLGKQLWKPERKASLVISLLFLFIAIVLLFSSCRTGQRLVVVEARDSVRVVERVREVRVVDTVLVQVPPQREVVTVRDSSSHLENDYALSACPLLADGLALPHARNEASHRHSCPRGGRAGARLDCLPGEGGSAGRLRGKGVELVCSAAPVAGKRDAGAYRRGPWPGRRHGWF